jgi:hypothetical protein
VTAPGDQLGPVARCPLPARCEACGGDRDLDLTTYQMRVGVFCATICGPCLAAGNPPPIRSWGQACERVGEHCGHLGIDLDQMAALLRAEHEEGSG